MPSAEPSVSHCRRPRPRKGSRPFACESYGSGTVALATSTIASWRSISCLHRCGQGPDGTYLACIWPARRSYGLPRLIGYRTWVHAAAYFKAISRSHSEPPWRLELQTYGLRNRCSTTELRRLTSCLGGAFWLFGSGFARDLPCAGEKRTFESSRSDAARRILRGRALIPYLARRLARNAGHARRWRRARLLGPAFLTGAGCFVAWK
jgi:hypothetical protein